MRGERKGAGERRKREGGGGGRIGGGGSRKKPANHAHHIRLRATAPSSLSSIIAQAEFLPRDTL